VYQQQKTSIFSQPVRNFFKFLRREIAAKNINLFAASPQFFQVSQEPGVFARNISFCFWNISGFVSCITLS